MISLIAVQGFRLYYKSNGNVMVFAQISAGGVFGEFRIKLLATKLQYACLPRQTYTTKNSAIKLFMHNM